MEPAKPPRAEAASGRDPPVPTAVADGREVCGLDIGILPSAIRLRDWLLSEAAHEGKANQLLTGLAEQLRVLGVEVDRVATAMEALHSEYSGIGRIWTREEGLSERLFPHGAARDEAYEKSPFFHVHQTREWLFLDLHETEDERFSVIAELKAAGYRSYLVVPIFFTNGSANGMAFAKRGGNGFTERETAILRFLMPTLAAALEMQSVTKRLDTVLRIYVGDEPHKAILSGAIQRGQVTRIRSAILFADMRGYTRITSGMNPEEAVAMLNAFFDCLVPPIEGEGGEVLKYMGDGLLAIFRDRGDDTGSASQAALNAALQALVRIDDANTDGAFAQKVAMGIALHHGEAAYGNVGSGLRLDFTVIGRDVNLASRIAGMNKILGEPLLMSRSFADHLWGDPESLGSHRLDGFAEPVPIYRLRAPGAAGAAGEVARGEQSPALA